MDTSLTNDAIAALCANQGAWLHYAAAALGASVGASLLANLRRYIPAPVMSVLDLVALNFVKEFAGAAPPAPPTPPTK